MSLRIGPVDDADHWIGSMGASATSVAGALFFPLSGRRAEGPHRVAHRLIHSCIPNYLMRPRI